jgi:EmrB/QacA subfamily drug resistance transporter
MVTAAAGQDEVIPTDRFDRALRRTAIVVVLGTVMANLDTTIVNVSIDHLAKSFRAPISTIQWVASGYMLALGAAIPLTAWSMQRFGGRRMWVASLSVFLAGSILCGSAWSVTSLIVFRVIQGLGGGIILPLGQALLTREAGPRRIGRVMGIVGIPLMLAPVLGPVVGGLITDRFSWRFIFFINAPLALVALVLGARLLPFAPSKRAGARRLDFAGFALITPGLALMVYGLSTAGSDGSFSSPLVQLSIGAGACMVVGFVLRCRRSRYPLVNLGLFRTWPFALGCGISFLVSGALFGSMFLAPLYFQQVRGQSALQAGLLMAPQGIGAMCTMNFSGRVVDRVGASRVAPLGFLMMTLGTIPFVLLTGHTSETLLVVALVVRGLGMGLGPMPATAASYQRLAREDMPEASTVMSIVQRVGATFFTAAMAVALEAHERAAHVVTSTGPQLASSFSATYWIALVATIGSGLGALCFPHLRRDPMIAKDQPDAPPGAELLAATDL